MIYKEIINQMHTGVTIVTPNNRLSRHLVAEYYQHQEMQSIKKPSCLSYQSLLQQLLNKIRHEQPYKSHPIVLTPTQQRLLWKNILKENASNGILEALQQGWSRCQQWLIDFNEDSFAQTEQTLKFKNWCLKFQDYLQQNNFITLEQIPNYIKNETCGLDHHKMIWVCFDDITPQQKMLQQHFECLNCSQESFELPHKHNNVIKIAADSPTHENINLVSWLKLKLEQGETKIGVVVPDLQTEYNSLKRFLERHIAKDLFNISLGKPLSDAPIIAHALNWLMLDKQKISNHQMRLLLHSPFLIHSKQEQNQRYQAMQSNYLLKEEQVDFNTWIAALKNISPILAETLVSITDYPEITSPQDWSESFKARLSLLKFPGEYSLDSANFQYFKRFIGILDEFVHLALIKPNMTRQQALDALNDLTQSTIFQIRTPTTPIQILGLLEASGCSFDSIWIKGLTDQCLPQKTNFSAFIPIDIQKNYQMPYSSAIRELQLSQNLIGRFINSCQQITCSYSRFIGDTPQLPSPLIISFSSEHNFTLEEPEPTNTALISYEENYTVPLTADTTITGGTALLEKQAQCPFKAFVAHRLHAKELPEISFGPNLSERGQLIHRCLELFWGKIKSQNELFKHSENELANIVDDSINQALQPLIQQRKHSFSKLIQEVEQERLRKLIYAALEWEKQRPPFTVKNIEQTFVYNLNGINLQVRIDRIDLLNTEDSCIIDYKTSLPASKPWNNERLEYPQLPLYACLEPKATAVLFLQLKNGQVSLLGLRTEHHDLPGVSTLKPHENWDDYKQLWHTQLSVLAEEFKAGKCTITPIRNTICAICQYQSLCRINQI